MATCADCDARFEVAPRGRMPRRCETCRTPAPKPERPVSARCQECDTEFPVPAMGQVPKLCVTCRADWRLLEQRRREKREVELEPRLHESLVQIRLRVEAAKPLLRIAIMKKSWGAVQAALAELEGELDGTVLDIRSIVSPRG